MKRHVLNVILPMRLRTLLRRAALSAIPSMRHLDMPRRLRHLKSLGFEPRVILDVGAASGDWARLAASIWPGAVVFGFEPNLSEHENLERAKRELPRFDYRHAFLGPARGRVSYRDAGHQTSLLGGDGEAGGGGVTREADVQVLDDLVREGAVPRPDFIKLDVQGFEMEVLKGATEVLAGCQGVLLEVNFHRFHPQVATADEVIGFMRDRGFAWYDTMGLLRRPSDDAVWQMDLMFLKADHPLRADTQGHLEMLLGKG